MWGVNIQLGHYPVGVALQVLGGMGETPSESKSEGVSLALDACRPLPIGVVASIVP